MTSPDLAPRATDEPLRVACERLREIADRSAVDGPWQSGGMRLLADLGILGRFVPADCGGSGASEPRLVATLASLAHACLTTALAVSQWAAAVRVITTAKAPVRAALLPALARGETFTTVGISQLTTSRQHLGRPALMADRDGDGWRLDGLCPWVTGAEACDTIVAGAMTPTEGQMFFMVSTAATGLAIDCPLNMLALSGSRTAAVRFRAVRPTHAIASPEPNAPRTGGLATTALAIGSARAAIEIVGREAGRRDGLAPIAAGLSEDLADLTGRLDRAASTAASASEREGLRAAANDLVLRAGQATLAASKGAGFVRGHPAERLVRESLFFLVWSCPQAVTDALLCDLAGR